MSSHKHLPLLLSLASCSDESPTGSSADASADTGADTVPMRTPPLDNALCRRVVSTLTLNPGALDSLTWIIEVMGLPRPNYTGANVSFAGGNYGPLTPFYSAQPPRESRIWELRSNAVVTGWVLVLQFPDSIVDAPIGRTYRFGTDLDLVSFYYHPDGLEQFQPTMMPRRDAVAPFAGELSVTVVGRDASNTTPVPMLRLDGLLCESGGVLAFASRSSLFRSRDWPRER